MPADVPSRPGRATLLAFELATEACSVALWHDGRVLARHEVAPRRHAELALPGAEALLAEAHGQQRFFPAGLRRRKGERPPVEPEFALFSERRIRVHLEAAQGTVHEAAGEASLPREVADQGPGFEGRSQLQPPGPLRAGLPGEQRREAPLPDLPELLHLQGQAVV